jgi:Spy/CpxP family protein refolding chaperone
MKALTLVTVALCVAAPLAAQGPGRMGQAGPPTMDELATRLKLTPAQRAEIAPLHAAHVKEVEPFRETARAEMAAARSARQSGAPAESVAVHQAKARTAMQEIRRRSEQWQERLSARLTEEQKSAWKRWEDERRGARRGARPGGMPRSGGQG